MTAIQRQGFQVGLPLVARRPFSVSGHQFDRGDPVPWRDLGLTPEHVAKIYNAGHVFHRIEPEESAAEAGLGDKTMRELREMAKAQGVSLKPNKAAQLEALRAAQA